MFHKREDEITKHWKNDEVVCSIICITYNHASFIERCLNGFLEQISNFAFEIIIHDDCSTDGTTEIIKAYERKYPKIIKAMYENENQYSKKENGRFFIGDMCKMAKKYIALCEGDDYWTDSSKLQTQVDFLESNNDYVLTYHKCNVIDSSGNLKDSNYPQRDVSGYELQTIRAVIPTRCAVYRNVIDFMEPTLMHYYKRVLNADTFLWILLGKFGGAKFLPSIKPAVYTVHDGGVWSSLDKIEQYKVHTKSFFDISSYFATIGDSTLASYYLSLSIDNLLLASEARLDSASFNRIIKALINKTNGGGGNPLLTIFIIFPRCYHLLKALRDRLRVWRSKYAT